MIDVRLPDGTLIRNVPDGMSKADLTAKLARNGYDVSKLGAPNDSVSQIPGNASPVAAQAPAKDNLLGKVVGTVIEAPLALVSSAPASFAGNIAGVAGSVMDGTFGTKAGTQQAQRTASDITRRLSYQPRTATGNALMQGIGQVAQDSGVAGVPIPTLNALATTMTPARNALALQGRALAENTTGKVNNAFSTLQAKRSALPGVGAARTSEEAMRITNAQSLPVPIKLTKGQATRTFDQQRFERETAKMPEGEPLRVRFADQNEQMLKNFDAFADETGATANSLRQTGEMVDSALARKIKEAKENIRTAYGNARNAGDMSEPVSISRIRAYLEDNRPASLNAPVLTSAESGLKKIDPSGMGVATINDLEELRKMARRLAQPGTPNQVYGQEIIDLIDGATRGKGGPLYKEARAKYETYATDFRDRAAVSKITRLKPGTADRAVALEDVFDHSIMRGSLDDVQAIHKALNNAGKSGQQAWRELQGQTISQIKERITKNVARDVRGNPVVSPAELDKLVRTLDADGKLDFVFGKQTAQKIRDINDLAKDVYTSPPGSVNSSNTAGVLLGLLDTAVSGISGLPLPIATTVNFGRQKLKSRAVNKKVENALNP